MMIREFTHKDLHFSLRNEIFNIIKQECILVSAWKMNDGKWFCNNGIIYSDFKNFWEECTTWIAAFAKYCWEGDSEEVLVTLDALFGGC